MMTQDWEYDRFGNLTCEATHSHRPNCKGLVIIGNGLLPDSERVAAHLDYPTNVHSLPELGELTLDLLVELPDAYSYG